MSGPKKELDQRSVVSYIGSSMDAAEIRAAREARGWTPAELGEAVGVCERTIYRWEKAERIPTKPYQTALASVLKAKELIAQLQQATGSRTVADPKPASRKQ